MPRENFTAKTRSLIESSAGHQCSFPACNQRTTGPGTSAEFVSNSGYAAHIYSAASGGPRGQGDLSPEELRDASNGIWLCGRHAKLIDNNQGSGYPPEVLLSYKALHEARVSLEHEGLYPPIGWLHELTIVTGPLFSEPQTIQLAKLNLIYGKNCTGKTAIVEWICGFFDSTALDRWIPTRQKPLNLRLSMLNPKLQNLSLRSDGMRVRYSVGGKPVAYIPIGISILKPRQLNFSIADDLELLARALDLPRMSVESLMDEVNVFPHATVSNLRLETAKDDEGNALDHLVLRADVQGTAPGLPLRALSSRESERVVMELITAAARLSGRYQPTLLVLDDLPNVLFDGFFEFYSHHLLDTINQFQTLMCIPDRYLDLEKVQWNGWQVIRTQGQAPNITLHQNIRKRQG